MKHLLILLLLIGCADASSLEPGINVANICSKTGCGTAFAIDEHKWATANHVVDADMEVTIWTIDGQVKATVMERQLDNDIAILFVRDFISDNPIDTCKADWGEHVAGCGYDGSKIGDTYILQCESGTIGNLRSSSDDYWPGSHDNMIFSFVSANHGWSGGPMVNKDGCVVGMIVGGNNDEKYSRAVKVSHLN